jgi:hypothetical protein
MRVRAGWVAVAVAAAGCGGSAERAVSRETTDEHQGQDAVCPECSVQGSGANAFGLQFTVAASPESGADAGPGFGGEGVAAKGIVHFFTTTPGEGAVDVLGTIDTILSCSRTNGVLAADLLGSIGPSTRFFLHVEDAGDPSSGDLLALSIQTAPGGSLVLQVAQGDVHVHQLDRCGPPSACPEGQCSCPDTGMCEPCHEPPPPNGDTTSPPPGDTTSPPPGGGTNPPPGPFIPL